MAAQDSLNTKFIKFESIIEFECDELSKITELYRVLSVFDSVTTAFLVIPQKVNQRQIEKVIESVKNANKEFPHLLNSKNISKFINICNMISNVIINNRNGNCGLITNQ